METTPTRPRLRVLPTILFSVVVVLFLALTATAAYPADAGEVEFTALMLLSGLGSLVAAIPALACGAFIVSFGRTFVLPLLVPLTGGLAYFVTGDIAAALLALCFFAPVYLLSAMLRAEMPRTAAVCRLSVCCALIGAGFFVLSLFRVYGSMGREALGALADALYRELSSTELYVGALPAGQTVVLPAEADLAAMAELLLSMAPAMVVLFFNTIAWLAHGLLLFFYRAHGLTAILPPSVRTLTMSFPAVLVFLFSAVGSVLFHLSSSLYLAEMVSVNLFTIFEPPFVLIGLGGLRRLLGQGGSNVFTILLLLILSLFCCSPTIAALAVACVGAARTLRRLRPSHPGES